MRIGTRSAALVVASCAFGGLFSVALAREPGAADTVPGGASANGIPGGIVPPGIAVINDFRYFTGKLQDNNGHDTGLTISVTSWTPQLFWNPNLKVLGASYGAGLVLPIANTRIDNDNGFGKYQMGTSERGGTGNILVRPLHLSWALQPDLFVSTGFSFYVPTGSYNTPLYWQSIPGNKIGVNSGNNFYTFQPELAVSYFKPGPEGYNLSLQALYNTNTENKSTGYKSGDQILLNYTATKAFGPVSAGLTGFYKKQVTADQDNGHWFAPNGQQVPMAPPFVKFPIVDVTSMQQKFGIGPTVSTRIGEALVDLSWMHDFNVRNDLKGDTYLLHVKFFGLGADKK